MNKKVTIIAAVSGGLLIICLACLAIGFIYSKNPAYQATTTTRAINVAIEEATKTAQPSNTPVPTKTPAPTNTPKPTNTPRPTNTPAPTLTSTPAPDPVVLTGTGDQVVDVEKWAGPALAKITHQGGGNFIIWTFDSNGNKIELLVNTIGNFDGIVPLDFIDGQATARFQVTAGGSWEIQVLPMSEIRMVDIPGKFDGTGPDVVYLKGSNPDLLKVDGSKLKANVIVWAYSSKRSLVVNEIGPYSGTVILPKDAHFLVINATGEWSMEVTTR